MDRPDSLAAQLFLLAYDTKRQRLVSRSELGYALRAAALADLVLRGSLVDDGGKPVPGSPAPGADPVLDPVLLDNTTDAGKAGLKAWQSVPGMDPLWPLSLSIEGWTTYDPNTVPASCKGA